MVDIEKRFDEIHNFWVVTCPNGHLITEWNEGDDVREFSAFSIAYCPKDKDLTGYHCIEKERAEALYAERDALLQKEFEEEVEKIPSEEN